MKALKLTILSVLLVLILVLSASAAGNPNAESLSMAIQKACPARFGYVDNTQYYMSTYFSELKNIADHRIVTAADSTDFSQICVFQMSCGEGLASNKKLLTDYIKKAKKDFESGVVYNIEEYPKFENATVFSKGNYLIYVILDKNGVKNAEQVINEPIT